MGKRPISILMATYNGEKYVAEQLDSLFSQTVQYFDLFIQDDCSTDRTVEILRRYEKKHPEWVHVAVNEVNSGAAKNNFMRLMIEHKNDYVMLCDQDDVWEPEKIQTELDAMRQAEAVFGKDTPLLVHTDLTVVNVQMKQIAPSFRKMEHLNYRLTGLNRLLVQNTVTGCTAMMNRSLADMINQMPASFIQHDWWLVLVASAFGKIVPLAEQRTVRYRQHGNNQVGARDAGSAQYLFGRLTDVNTTKERVEQTYRQAAAFLETYTDLLSKEQKELITTYCAIPALGKLWRIGKLFRLQAWKHGLPRILGQLVYI